MKSNVMAVSVLLFAGVTCGGVDGLIPKPIKVEVWEGVFVIGPETRIMVEADTKLGGEYLAGMLRRSTGLPLPIGEGADRNSILLTLASAKAELGQEGYELEAKPDGVVIRAPAGAGAFYGVQTLLQLLSPQVYSTNKVLGVAWNVPCVKIEDKPRFSWRGLMLDSGHDYQNLSFIYRYIDLMALHKFNTFHWHITDYGNWPLEIKGYPKLQNPSTRRQGVRVGVYTQDQVREVVKYAAARYITIVPEIDMPGHSTPALLAYPELDCPGPSPIKSKCPVWCYCVSNEKTYAFLETVLTQVLDLFPSKFIHIGGDECPKQHWKQCPSCQAKIKSENLNSEMELQSYFVKRIEKFLNARGRRLIGWDEILEGGLAPHAAVMSWRGMEGGIKAAKAGHDVVMAPNQFIYFDTFYKYLPLEKVYTFDPIPPQLTPEEAKHILGAEGQMWSDYRPKEELIEAHVYPRGCALIELIWSDPRPRDWDEFVKRLEIHLQRLKVLNVKYTPLKKK